MAEKERFEGVTGYCQGIAKDFTPITVSADFGALARLQLLVKTTTTIALPKVDTEVAKAA